jgi:hypothetical protein
VHGIAVGTSVSAADDFIALLDGIGQNNRRFCNGSDVLGIAQKLIEDLPAFVQNILNGGMKVLTFRHKDIVQNK